MTKKSKMSKKAVKEIYGTSNIYAVSYCALQYMLRATEPFAYSARTEGWACDYYELCFGDKVICVSTGYDPIGKHVDYDTCKLFDDKARRIWSDETNYEKAKAKIDNLIKDFVGTII